MKTANEKILDNYIAHKIYLLQFADGIAKELSKELLDTEDQLEGLLYVHAKRLQATPIGTKAYITQRRKFINAIVELRHPAFETIRKRLVNDIKEVIIDEAQFAATTIQNALPVDIEFKIPSKDSLKQLAVSTPMAGKPLNEWISSTRNRDTLDITDGIVNRLGQGLSIDDAVSAIVGTSRTRNNSIIRKSWNNIEGIAHSSVTNAQTQATEALAEVNPFVITDEKFVATLDGGTTFICIGNDQTIHKIGEGPMPPLHFRCRSLRVPFINADRISGRPFDARSEKLLIKDFAEQNNLGKIAANSRDNLPYGYKTKYDKYARSRMPEFVGLDPDPVDYGTWLSRQTNSFQEDVLGITRARVFRESGLPISSFIDTRGKLLTLEDLRKKGLLDD